MLRVDPGGSPGAAHPNSPIVRQERRRQGPDRRSAAENAIAKIEDFKAEGIAVVVQFSLDFGGGNVHETGRLVQPEVAVRHLDNRGNTSEFAVCGSLNHVKALFVE
jgi:hypothetical protein